MKIKTLCFAPVPYSYHTNWSQIGSELFLIPKYCNQIEQCLWNIKGESWHNTALILTCGKYHQRDTRCGFLPCSYLVGKKIYDGKRWTIESGGLALCNHPRVFYLLAIICFQKICQFCKWVFGYLLFTLNSFSKHTQQC